MRPSVIGETLVACLCESPGLPSPKLRRSLAGGDHDRLSAAADHHGVAAWVHAMACAAKADALAARLEPALFRAQLSRTQTAADLSVAATALDHASIPWLVFKGPVLDEVIHQPPYYRAYSDLDLLVPAPRLGDALEALEATGAVVLDENWAMFRQALPGEVHLRLPYGSVADLHWHFLGTVADRTRFRFDMAGILARRRSLPVAGIEVATMDAVDTLVHVAFHAASHGGNRLLWLKDIEQCVLHEPPAWDVVTARSDQWGVSLSAATMLARTRQVLGLAVPDRVLRSLGYRPPWSTLTGAIDRLTPTERTRGGRSLSGMTAAAAGKDQWESLAPIVRRTARAVAHPRNMPPPGPSRDPANPSSPLHPSGGTEGRGQYLSAVAQEA
jgi:hypothetical protein